MTSKAESLPYRIETSKLSSDSFTKRPHPINPESIRHTLPLGDRCGLTQLGVHLCHVDPHIETTVMHWHANEDEWMYVLDAGAGGATLIIQGEGDAAPREEKIGSGDFLGFPAGKANAHAMRAGDEELVYLCSGTRAAMDVCRYPAAGKTLIIDRTEGGRHFFVDEKASKDY